MELENKKRVEIRLDMMENKTLFYHTWHSTRKTKDRENFEWIIQNVFSFLKCVSIRISLNKAKSLLLECLLLKIKKLRSFKTSINIYHFHGVTRQKTCIFSNAAARISNVAKSRLFWNLIIRQAEAERPNLVSPLTHFPLVHKPVPTEVHHSHSLIYTVCLHC
jgi:hypothetical protein